MNRFLVVLKLLLDFSLLGTCIFHCWGRQAPLYPPPTILASLRTCRVRNDYSQLVAGTFSKPNTSWDVKLYTLGIHMSMQR